MQTEELVRELPKGLLKWYEFQKDENALVVTGGMDEFNVLPDMLRECGVCVVCKSLAAFDNDETENTGDFYQYIVIAGVLECSRNPQRVLQRLYRLLKPGGRIFLGTDNRLGIRYFCGDRDRFTERNFDSIEGYARISPADRENLGGRAYAKAEIMEMLNKAGFAGYQFYSVFPVLERPQVLYADGYLPKERLDIRIAPQYHNPNTVFLEQERLYSSLMANGLLHTMANGYLIECVRESPLTKVDQVTISMDRGRKDALATLLYKDGKVVKKAVYLDGQQKLKQLADNMADLREHGIRTVDIRMEKDSLIMPCIQGTNATEYFRNLLLRDQDAFLREMDRFWQLIQQSSEHVPYDEVDWERFDPDWKKRKQDDPNKDKWKRIAFGTQEEQENLGVILRRGYIDLVSLNCFYAEGDFVFFDQEFYVENLPAKVILLRTIDFIYAGNTQLELCLAKTKLMERYCLHAYYDLWVRYIRIFLQCLRNEGSLYGYHQLCRANAGIINANRQRMNYSVHEYEALFRDIFKGVENKEIYLFGSGQFAKKFLSQFGREYQIAGIFDNNQEKWGGEVLGVKIMPPGDMLFLQAGTYKVIICIKNYVPVIKQLQKMGVREYAVYDCSLEYARKMPVQVQQSGDAPTQHKKYHVGYISGVFDLFHVGHLNMFKRAKEQCDYLIVGVVTDESVIKDKKTMPYIPFEERMEIVRSCRYVDEVVEIPPEDGSPDEAYRRYQFDVQFAGSDYADSSWWKTKQEAFRKMGSDIVFFPYTQSTSSTKLKTLIEKNLL